MAKPKSIKAALPGIGRILHKFAPQIRKQQALLCVSFIALVLETVMRLLEPWPLKFIFDQVILPQFESGAPAVEILANVQPMVLLTGLCVALVLIAGLRGATAYLSTVGLAIAATRIVTDVRANLYSHLQRLSLSFHSKAKSGDLITRVTYDVERLREVAVVAALPLFSNMLTVVGMIGVMFFLNWELALIAIAIGPLFLLSSVRMSRKIREVARVQRKREGAMAAVAAESMGAIKVVQALSLQTMLEQNFSTHNQKSLREAAQAQKLSAGLERTVEVLVAISTALVLWRGSLLVLRQAVTPGDLLVFTTYLKVAFKPMRQLAKYTGQIAKATASGERIVDLLDQVPDVQDLRGAKTAPDFRGAIRFERVSFFYETEHSTLHNINFKVQPGQHVALVGPSGGGKSTLVSLLLRFYDPQEGRILIDGHDLREYKLDSLRRQISIVLQDSVLFATTVRENIAYGCLGASDREVEAAAKLANAHDFILRLPQGYNTILGERGATLSGGQRQRIAIARAAIRKAPIVILDEPTTGLDNESERSVSEALDRLTQGCTTFLISHNLRATEHADQIFYIENGTILERGTHCELMQAGGSYANLYQLQAIDSVLSGGTDHAVA
ncbi:ABC transporter ATP-binding protein [Thermocoleostomius sinensis]|jgi:ATP-binding cassette subfamily B protein|uniref:ABC transporter ATP-binding protein n=1 Tax=Thermocoleostomius sinensis A174 TaxID=2016057 RepID=A0A9E8ZHN8_9CYAN|nr:ABC transporter ATP-binding protein [Thermocoleostomius sinensis]WAL58706.1 ABC transporter ATP-binding protein [Thermocoleostomius sinensis A174]